MRGGGIILSLIVGAVFVALYAPLLLKASDQLGRYRPDPFRSARAPVNHESFHSANVTEGEQPNHGAR